MTDSCPHIAAVALLHACHRLGVYWPPRPGPTRGVTRIEPACPHHSSPGSALGTVPPAAEGCFLCRAGGSCACTRTRASSERACSWDPGRGPRTCTRTSACVRVHAHCTRGARVQVRGRAGPRLGSQRHARSLDARVRDSANASPHGPRDCRRGRKSARADISTRGSARAATKSYRMLAAGVFWTRVVGWCEGGHRHAARLGFRGAGEMNFSEGGGGAKRT